MAADFPFRDRGPRAVPLADLSAGVLDPVLRKRAGLSVALVQAWEEIVGPHVSRRSRPEKIQWPKRVRDSGRNEPATLVIACEGSAALELQHETTEIIARVNRFIGSYAIGRIKLIQKPIYRMEREKPAPLRPLSLAESKRLASTVAAVENPDLRAALERLGASVMAKRR
ncbi:DciA family protein [Mesorhizobium sp. RP14(2022)]|uniref:DciA family protein n=1 Tax=Mesorhizobium liriopis TaxID=2953882 RepID=A0ABT1C162_9HYPH|nr:DciA family protein [Mesorhizobium liriopis]MCO6048567.1 DciA family protein [Mesorhizobium liriopis]